MMFEGKHIHFSPVDNRPLCSYSGKLCRQRRINRYAFCIRHILEDKTAPFKQCAHVAKYNNQKCTNPIPTNEDREFCNSHMQVAGMAPKKERRNKCQKDFGANIDGKLKLADRVKVLLQNDGDGSSPEQPNDCYDDPYAFPDAPYLEMTNSSNIVSNVASIPIEGEVRNSPEIVRDQTIDLLPVIKQEPIKTGGCVLDKPKDIVNGNIGIGNANRSLKTINRLESKINRSRIFDKLKRNCPTNGPCNPPRDSTSKHELRGDCVETNDDRGESSSPSPTPPLSSAVNNSRVCSTLNHANRTTSGSRTSSVKMLATTNTRLETPVVCPSVRTTSLPSIPPKKRAPKWSWKRPDLVPKSLQTYRKLWLEEQNFRRNLFPLGFEVSDSDSDLSDGEDNLHQRYWFNLPTDDDSWPLSCGTETTLRSMRLSMEKAELRRRCIQQCRSNEVSALRGHSRCVLAKSLTDVSRSQAPAAAKLVEVTARHCQRRLKNNNCIKNLALTKQTCCYSNEDSECSNTALPYTRHCIKHIMYNVDQLLFEHCTAKFADNTQCCIPVFDICHELPLCLEHARKRDNYSRLSSEPKPKKPRKKTKPSALTRPPKRGKKKKRQSSFRSCEADLPSLLHSSSEMPSTLHHFSINSSDLSPSASGLGGDVSDDLDGTMEPDLGTDLGSQLSPGTIDKSLDLPIDAVELANQASRLLEDHDFTEVLNKIPEEAFRELFNEGKNGDLLPSKEEAEELERALAAVDKDVKSLVKLSSVGHLDLHDSLLHGDHLVSTLDSTLSDLAGSGIGIDVIAGSLTSSDINSISQVLSTMSNDGQLAHIPMLSDMVGVSPQCHVPHSVGSGFAVSSQMQSGRMDDTRPIDSYITVLDSIDASNMSHHHQWTNDRSQIGHNGIITSQSYGHALMSPRFSSHTLLNSSKLEPKGRNHYNNLGSGVTNLLENSIGLSPVPVTELTESSTESVS